MGSYALQRHLGGARKLPRPKITIVIHNVLILCTKFTTDLQSPELAISVLIIFDIRQLLKDFLKKSSLGFMLCNCACANTNTKLNARTHSHTADTDQSLHSCRTTT